MAIQSFIENGARFDGDTYSLKYFNISKNFTLLKKGKNTITLAPDFTVVPGSRIEVELLDKFGNFIRVEYPNQITPNGDLVLHITIDDTVPEGVARMYIRGIAYKDVDTGLKLDTSRFNIIWRGLSEIKLSDDSDTPKDPDDIVFDKPQKEISIRVEKKDFSYKEKDSDRPTDLNGTGFLTYYPTVESNTFSSNVANKPTTRTKESSRPISTVDSGASITSLGNPTSNSDGYPTIKSSVEEFTSDMIGGVITVTPIITNRVPPIYRDNIGTIPEYTATILDVVNSTTIVVDTHFYHTVPNPINPFVADSFTATTYSLHYNKDVPTTDGQKVTGYAQLCFDNVATSNGKVDKVRVSAKPVGAVGGAMLIGDYDVIPPNKMQDTSNFSFDPRTGLGYKNVGDVTSNDDITTYYESAEYTINNNTSSTLDTYTYDEVTGGSPPSPTQRNTNLSNALSIESPIADNNIVAISVKDSYLGSAKADTKYTVTLNAYSENDSTSKKPIAKVFISGPAIREGGDTSNKFGTLIDTIEGGNGQTQKNLKFSFTADTDSDTIKLYLVLETGKWDFSGIKIEPDSTTNNSPNEFCVLVPLDNLPVNKIDEEYVFVVDFIAQNGNPTNLNLITQSVTLNSNTTIDQTLVVNTINSSTLIQNTISGISKWYANEGGTCAEIAGGNTLNFSEGSVIDMSMDAPSKTLTICHGSVCAAGSCTATANYFIDSVTLDSFGHVTGLTTNCVTPEGYFWNASDDSGATCTQIDCNETVSIIGGGDTSVSLNCTTNTFTISSPIVNNCTICIEAGTGLSGGGSFSLNQSSNCTICLTATGGGVTINNNTDNYVITATGTANTINGESTLTYNDSTGTLCATGAGGVCVTNCVTADNFITTSDIRLKSDIKELKCSIDVLKKFKSYMYTKGGYEDAGFIAQEVCEAIPYTVTTNTEGYLTMRDRPILAYMHNAIVELNNRIDCLESKIGK